MIFYRNIEDILAEKGESVKRLAENDSLESLVKDLANRIEKGEPSKDEDDAQNNPFCKRHSFIQSTLVFLPS